jgi:hypothetical protein
LAGVLAFAVWKMWARCTELERRNDELQERRITDLKEIVRPDD